MTQPTQPQTNCLVFHPPGQICDHNKPTQPTQDPKCPACKNGVEAKKTIVGEFNTLCDKHQNDINGYLTSLTTPAAKPLDDLIDETDIGIILSDYMGSRWNGNMRDDIVDMVNLKYKARIATLQAKEDK